MRLKVFLLSILIIVFSGCSLVSVQDGKYQGLSHNEKKVLKDSNKFLQELLSEKKYPILSNATAIDSVKIEDDSKKIEIYFNKYLSSLPMRSENVTFLYNGIKENLRWKFRNHDLSIQTLNTPIEEFIPNLYRESVEDYDRSKMPLPESDHVVSLVRKVNWKANPTKGLSNRNISVRNSHGWYFSNNSDRWEWQRPRLFQTVEDLFPTAFILPYLMPMLENAGANVFTPRERDWQTHEVVVDNDSSENNSSYSEYIGQNLTWKSGDNKGFGLGLEPYKIGENPFRNGTYRYINTENDSTAKVEWIPNIPEDGEYAVYISYFHDPENVTDAHYTVYHLGGKTEFLVNQQIGGRTWIYLGKFYFAAGKNPEFCKVVLTNKSDCAGKFVSADAVRFGGGMGNVVRGGQISRRPRFMEAARYYMQYAGMPDSIYNINFDTNDYKDDYMARSEFENYLRGAPYGPNNDRAIKGLGIPVDLAFAFHTDAGITKDESVIGTLSIYSLLDAQDTTYFPDGISRIANRDLADIVQTEIVNDIKVNYSEQWTRRPLMAGGYSEAFRANIPSMLIELLSHQNFQDMKFGLDPKFRFDVARSIYKGMLKFLSVSYEFEYVVQPLPVNNFQATFTGDKEVTLKWKPQTDKQEPTAIAEQYIVYTRINDLSFDNGQLVNTNSCVMKNLVPGVQYSFKITAVNDGGESFPSEILSVCWVDEAKETVLIVNNFDRISTAAIVDNGDFKGFANFVDEGVPDKFDLGYTGAQHDFSSSSDWLTNDYPGWGASYANYETKVIAGNSFDYPYIHGKSIKNCGFSYVSVSDEVVENSDINLSDYKIIDMVYGEERSTQFSANKDSIVYQIFTESMQNKIASYLNGGGNMYLSGAYIGTEMFATPKDTMDNAKFARNILKYNYNTNHAARNGEFFTTGKNYKTYNYNNEFSDKLYKLESPDAIVPAKNSGAKTFLRFKENSFGCGIYYKGDVYNLVLMTIPFEVVLNQSDRDDLMNRILEKFNFEK